MKRKKAKKNVKAKKSKLAKSKVKAKAPVAKVVAAADKKKSKASKPLKPAATPAPKAKMQKSVPLAKRSAPEASKMLKPQTPGKPPKSTASKSSSKKQKPTISTKPAIPVLKVVLCGPHSVHWIPNDTVIHQSLLDEGIHDKERLLIKDTKAPQRRVEFLRARWLCRRMTKSKDPLMRGKGGEPLWPDPVIGSISHKDGHVVAVKVTNLTHYAVGLDIEKLGKVHEGIESKICNSDESMIVDRVSALARLDRRDVLALIFAFKEAIFKAHFPKGQKHFGFMDATISEIAYDRREIFARMNIDTSPHSSKNHVTMGFYNWIDHGGSRYVVVVAEERKPLQIDQNLKQELLADA